MKKLLLAIFLSCSIAAHAKTQTNLEYDISAVWSTAVRLLRVDLNLKITEKDKETGYLLFEYKDDGQIFPASIQLSKEKTQSGAVGTRVIIHIKDRPPYQEDMLQSALNSKLKEENALPAKKPAPSKPPEDEKKEEKEPPK